MKSLTDFLLFLLGMKRKEEVAESYRPSVTVLIPAYNEENSIGKSIASVKKQTYPVKEILVVDDSSTDKTAEIAQKEGAIVIRTPSNTGLKAKALNFGLQYVNYEILVMIDADTELAPDAIEKIVLAFSRPQVLVAGGVVLSKEMISIWQKARQLQYFLAFDLIRSTQAHWNGLMVASGCFFSVRTDFLRKMGGFPTNTVAEDMALTWLAYLEEGEVAFLPNAKSFTIDPPNWSFYKAQILRWSRGFIQCFLIFQKELHKNRALQFFVWFSLITGILSPIFWITLPFFIKFFLENPGSRIILFWISFWLINLVITASTILKGAICHHFPLKSVLINFPLYLMVMIVDDILFLWAFIKEVSSRGGLKWEKGH